MPIFMRGSLAFVWGEGNFSGEKNLDLELFLIRKGSRVCVGTMVGDPQSIWEIERVAGLLPEGQRFTPQRREVYGVVAESRDHPTASDVFMRAKEKMPAISLATVYNCLEMLTACGALRQVSLERSSARYCANRDEHAHFYCDSCGEVVDAPSRVDIDAARLWQLPQGAAIHHMDVALHGTCPSCAEKKKFLNN
jgi:Fe2+ or Zn2+ uptake regulation protein